VNRGAGVLLALLAACQSPSAPKSLVDEGTPTRHTLREEPHRAAVCIARNIDRHGRGYTARIQQSPAPALIEVDVRAERPVSLARVFVEGEGSVVEIWMTADAPNDREALIAAMIAGC
jgi:hypothetical protein